MQSARAISLRWDLEGRVAFLNDFGLRFFTEASPRESLLPASSVRRQTSVPCETETSGRDLFRCR